MTKNRLEAFSDGVLAIIITIMVLALQMPHSANWESLKPLLPTFISYGLSFLFIGIYWGNHHHLLSPVIKINIGIMLANLHLLFWLSLLPLATSWMGYNDFAPNTIALYSLVSAMCVISFGILQLTILKSTPSENILHESLKKQIQKTIRSTCACLLAIPLSYVNPILSGVLFLMQLIVWIIPDKHIERQINIKS